MRNLLIASSSSSKQKSQQKTSDFVQAGFFKNRNKARKVLRNLAEQGIVTMKKGENKRYSYGLPKEPAGAKA